MEKIKDDTEVLCQVFEKVTVDRCVATPASLLKTFKLLSLTVTNTLFSQLGMNMVLLWGWG